MTHEIHRMVKAVRTQDNAITADPIFMVQQKQRVYGFDVGYTDDWAYFEKDDVESEVTEAERKEAYANYKAERINAGDEDSDVIDEDEWCNETYDCIGYKDEWLNVQPFFTREGAEHYIKINGHNLKEPRIYVESAFRNHEWQEIRNWLLQGAPNVNGWIDAKVALPSIDENDKFNKETHRSPDVLLWDGKTIAQGYLQYDYSGPPFEEPPRWWIGDDSQSVTRFSHWCALPAPPSTHVDKER